MSKNNLLDIKISGSREKASDSGISEPTEQSTSPTSELHHVYTTSDSSSEMNDSFTDSGSKDWSRCSFIEG